MKKSKNILKYSQPDFYKFSRDSVELAIIAADLESSRESIKALELFSGCGVISIEFESRHNFVDHVTFVELQEDFREHIEANADHLSCNYEIIIDHFFNIKKSIKYDIVFANPPYFNPDHSRVGSDPRRNLCRFSFNFEFKDLINALEILLKDNGVAYISHRDSLDEKDSRIERVGDFSGVGLFRFHLNKY